MVACLVLTVWRCLVCFHLAFPSSKPARTARSSHQPSLRHFKLIQNYVVMESDFLHIDFTGGDYFIAMAYSCV